MTTISSVLGLVLALASFLFGMRLMSQALRGETGSHLHQILYRLTDHPLLGFVLGAILTAIIQSSSAMTVVVVTLVDAGVLSLLQAVPLIAGANVGTTITAQIISLQLYQMIIPACTLGLLFFCCRKTRKLGRVLIGLGLLFLGLRLMGLCLLPLLDLPVMQQLLLRCAGSPGYAFTVGVVVTAIVQSSSAVTGIVIGLSASQLITLPAALGLALGSNVGTCATALIASLSSGANGKRVALIHLLFNLVGAALVMPFFPSFVRMVAGTAPDLPRQIANGHTLFNLQTAVVFMVPLVCYRLFRSSK